MVCRDETDDISKIITEVDDYIIKCDKCTSNRARRGNFPEHVSEKIVNIILTKLWPGIVTKAKIGDLDYNYNNKTLKIEVKCFTSTGPSSFGPTEKWDKLLFIDLRDYKQHNIILYLIDLAWNNKKW
jgi:hypothetical protein